MLSRTHSYYTQVQVQMGVTGICKTHFLVWSPIDYYHEVHVIDFDQELRKIFFYNIPIFLHQIVLENHFKPTYMLQVNLPNKMMCPLISVDTAQRDMQTDEETSIMCDCKCGCCRWFHSECVWYIQEENEDLDCD